MESVHAVEICRYGEMKLNTFSVAKATLEVFPFVCLSVCPSVSHQKPQTSKNHTTSHTTLYTTSYTQTFMPPSLI